MSKLKKVKSSNQNNLDEMYHVCRWCKFYSTAKYGGGICVNRSTYSVDEDGEFVYDEVGIENSEKYYCSEWC